MVAVSWELSSKASLGQFQLEDLSYLSAGYWRGLQWSESLTGAGRAISKVAHAHGGQLSASCPGSPQGCLSILTIQLLTSATQTRWHRDVFYDLASEVPRFHFYHLPLALVPRGPHKGMNTERQRMLGALLEAGYHRPYAGRGPE